MLVRFVRTDAVLSPRRPSTDPLLDALKRSDSASEIFVSPSLSLSQMYPCSELDWLPLALLLLILGGGGFFLAVSDLTRSGKGSSLRVPAFSDARTHRSKSS